MTESVVTSGLPTPELEMTPETAPYWAAADKGKLVLPRCQRCGHVIWYPRTFCPLCGSADVEWIEASGRGTIYSYTVVRQSQGRFAGAVPYVLAYVELAEGPRVLTNITGEMDGLAVGDDVEAFFDSVPNGGAILRFQR